MDEAQGLTPVAHNHHGVTKEARKKAKEDALDWFKKHQYEVATAKSKETGKSVETIVAEEKLHNKQRRQGRKTRSIRNKNIREAIQ